MKQATISKAKHVTDRGLAEIYQSNGTQQALLHRDSPTTFTRITDYVKCRDFLVDTYSYAKENKDFGIYGFKFSGSSMQPDWNAVHILMRFDGMKSRENFLENVELIRAIEKKNKYKLTELMEADKEIVVIGDAKWLQNCLSFSLYSLLLRVACYSIDKSNDWIADFANGSSSDSRYIASVPRKTLTTVFDKLDMIATEEFCGFPLSKGTGTIHHNSGFISVFGHHTEISPATVKQNNHWKLMKERGLESKVA